MSASDGATWPIYSAVAEQRVADLVRSGRVFDYSGSAPVTELEDGFAKLHDFAYAVSFNSGTSALFAAFAALGIGAGDEVLVPNLTFLASASPLLWLDATSVLVDSEPFEPSIGLAAIQNAITPRTRAVVVTHLFGNPADIVAIRDLCSSRRVALIEDCSHAHASFHGSQHVGTFGDAAIYSIGSSKMISGGHGGLLVTRDPTIRDLAVLIGHFKPRTRTDLLSEELRRYAEFALGGNLRLSPVAAALALDHLNNIEQLSTDRQTNVDILDSAFRGPLEPVRTNPPRVNATHFDVVYRLPDHLPRTARDDLVHRLRVAGVAAAPPSTRPLNRVLNAIADAGPADFGSRHLRRLKEFAEAAPQDADLPFSVGQHDRMISLPAARLYRRDGAAAQDIVRRATPVLRSFAEMHA